MYTNDDLDVETAKTWFGIMKKNSMISVDLL